MSNLTLSKGRYDETFAGEDGKLVDYEDSEICKFLKYGFPVGYSKADLPVSESCNHTGANRFPERVDSFIQTELNYKAISGPFDSNPFSCHLAISLLNTVEKDEVSRRVIVDLSWPEGTSVNSGIDKNVYLGETISLLYIFVSLFGFLDCYHC